MFDSPGFRRAVAAAAVMAVATALWIAAPFLTGEDASRVFAQRSTLRSQADKSDTSRAEGDVPAIGGLAIDELADVRKAVVQIEAVGTFVDPDEGLRANAAGRGSGFIIDEAGIAVTNNHVVTGGALLRVFVEGEDEPRNARVLGVSECADLAVIDIQGEDFPYLEWYEDPIKVGLDVYAVGFPLGDPEFTMTRGIVAKERADGETSWASVDHVLQHDADITPGNSGGPLVEKNGKVVGINYRLNQAGQYFAISRDEALAIIEELRHGRDIDSLGINSEAVSDGESLFGIWAASVESGSPADDVGLEAGDIILSMEGLELAADGTMATYCEILRSHDPADVLSLEVLRLDTGEVLEGRINGRPLELSFSLADTLDEEGSEREAGQLAPAPAYEEYVTITDEQGIIAVDVPVEWGEVAEYPWPRDDDEPFGIQLWTSPDLERFANGWDTPGLIFYFSDQLNEEVSDQDLLDIIDYADNCTYAGRSELPEGFFSGSYDVWNECGEAGSTGLVMGLTPETDDYLLRLEVYSVSDADLDAVDRILDTFVITPVGQRTPPVDDDGTAGAIDDVDTSGLIYDYELLEDPAFSALIPDEWSDIAADDWLIDDEPYGLNVNVAPDLDAYFDVWSAPGFEVYVAELNGDAVDPYEMLDIADYSEACTYDDRIQHQHTIYGITYNGAFDVWRDCGEEGNTLLVLSALSDPADHMVIVYFQAVEDGDYEAFDILQRSFYVNTDGTAQLIEEGSALSRGQAPLDPQSFVTLTDEENVFSMAAPAKWDDVANEDWVIDNEVVGRSMAAAPDLVDFEETWDTPGVFLGVSQPFSDRFAPADLLDLLDFSDECVYDDRYDYDDGSVAGVYDIWATCGDVEGQAFIVLAANPVDDDGQLALFYVNLVTESDVAAFEQILATLSIGDVSGAMEARSVESLPTATIVTSALNVRSGPGTNFSRVDAVYENDELTVAGQSGDCAWLQILTPNGQPGWVSGSARYVALNGDCALIPEAEEASGAGASTGARRSTASGQGCYTFQNQLGAELNVTFTNTDAGSNSNFQVPPKGESRQCFDPGRYTYTLDAPPPWGSTNGELNVSAGDNYTFPINAE